VGYDPDTALGGNRHRFPSTRPSLIQAAAAGGAPARDALDAVIAVYWKPAYKHVRIQWHRTNEQAKDLVQAFFAVLIEQNLLAGFDPAKGRLRTWLRACLDHFVMKQDESAARLKRGGGIELVFDFEAAERELASTAPSVEDIFLREWQREMFALALDDFRGECRADGKHTQHRIFEQYDLAEGARPSYAELAAEHGVPLTAVTNYLAWARRELRRLVRIRMERS
jgi:DNA-directed RNA polymerase specialized sigma24 family protein